MNLYTSYAARCRRCHRPLTDPVSISLGMGPECRGRSGGVMEAKLCKSDEFSDQFDSSMPFAEGLVLKRFRRPTLFDNPGPAEVGGVITNVPHLVVHHSPDGFEFGYGGSGPADLALNICQLYLNMTGYNGQQVKCYDGTCFQLAYALHQEFKRDIVAAVPRTGVTLPFSLIDAWFQSHITSELLVQYSLSQEE